MGFLGIAAGEGWSRSYHGGNGILWSRIRRVFSGEGFRLQWHCSQGRGSHPSRGLRVADLGPWVDARGELRQGAWKLEMGAVTGVTGFKCEMGSVQDGERLSIFPGDKGKEIYAT